MVSSVLGFTRTRRSSGGSSTPVAAADVVAQLLQLRLGDAAAASTPTAPRGWRKPRRGGEVRRVR